MADLLHIFAYDIADDRRRSRVSRLLESEGARVQDSVFEVIQEREAAQGLARRVMQELSPGDLLRVYTVPLPQIDQIITYGGAPVQQGADYWLL